MRVVLADGSVLLREGIMRLLDEAEIEVVAQAGDSEDLLRKVRAHKPDVVVVDVQMPSAEEGEGMAAALTIREELPDIGVLVLSQHIEDDSAVELLADNAAGFGYLLKDRIVDVNQLLDAMHRVANGGSALDPEIVSRLVGRLHRDSPVDGLTRREREVLRLMAEGRTNHAIAESMVITRRAAEKHVTSIFTKLNLESTPDDHRRVLAVLEYLQRH
ncbi:MAG: response regulator transcription factor [Solirubrobacterales bacterium]